MLLAVFAASLLHFTAAQPSITAPPSAAPATAAEGCGAATLNRLEASNQGPCGSTDVPEVACAHACMSVLVVDPNVGPDPTSVQLVFNPPSTAVLPANCNCTTYPVVWDAVGSFIAGDCLYTSIPQEPYTLSGQFTYDTSLAVSSWKISRNADTILVLTSNQKLGLCSANYTVTNGSLFGVYPGYKPAVDWEVKNYQITWSILGSLASMPVLAAAVMLCNRVSSGPLMVLEGPRRGKRMGSSTSAASQQQQAFEEAARAPLI